MSSPTSSPSSTIGRSTAVGSITDPSGRGEIGLDRAAAQARVEKVEAAELTFVAGHPGDLEWIFYRYD